MRDIASPDKAPQTATTTKVRLAVGERRWFPHAAGLFLAAVYVTILLVTAKDIGFARDEGFYFTASEQYARWFKLLVQDPHLAVQKETVDRYWRVNSEHPSLMKILFGLSWILFYEELGIMSESTSFRFPGMLMSGLLLYLLVVFGTRLGGLRVGLFAAGALACMPRFFYHSHLNCFDVPITTMWLATAFAFWKSLSSLRWAIICGIVWGLALATKLNSFFIPPLFLFYYLVRYGGQFYLVGAGGSHRRGWQAARRGEGRSSVGAAATQPSGGLGMVAFPPIPLALFAMVLLGPLILLALWPWIWYDTFNRFGDYLSFHIHHPYYNIEYFGYTYFKPPFPFSYPFVMTLITVPFVTTVLAVVGMAVRLRLAVSRWLGRWWMLDPETRQKEESIKGASLFLFLNMFFPMFLIALPNTPIFGGTKHWMPAWPFIALFAAFGFKAASDGISRLFESWSAKGEEFSAETTRIRRAIVAVAMAILFLSAAGQQTEASHPFGLSHYTLPIGGTQGAADAGICRQFWGFTTGSALGWLNENVPPNGRVYFHDTAWDSYNMYLRDGTLRRDIRWSGTVEGSDVAMVHWEQHMSGYEYAIWTWMGTATPARVVSHQGVAILPLYIHPAVAKR